MSDNLSQEDIDRLLSGGTADLPSPPSEGELTLVTPTEADTLGEIGNISMGSAATTLSMLLGNKVEITTPRVKEFTKIEDVFNTSEDYVTVEIKYKLGLDGVTIFALKTEDTAVIADLMMGGSGKVENPEIGELQLSAVGEAMNQMIGTASTSMASMFNTSIDITPPEVMLQKAGTTPDLSMDVFGIPIIAVVFSLKVGDLIDSTIMQLMSLTSAQSQVARLMNSMNSMVDEVVSTVDTSKSAPAPSPAPAKNTAPPPQQNINAAYSGGDFDEPSSPQKPITVQPVQFASFDESPGIYGESNKNLDLVMDVKLKLTVELGRTELPIKKVLELTRGSVIELDKVAGEPVELFANGKLIAKGEVVVIEDNFGLRITNIVSPENRMKNL